jgi:transposase-like protein
METPKTLQEAIVYFSDKDRCFAYAVQLRWIGGKVTCPRCNGEKHSFIKTRRIWFCYDCKKQFTLKVGTVMEDSAITLDKWMAAFWACANCKNGISSHELGRMLGIHQESAWFMLQRIRWAMQDEETGGKRSGPVEMDETFIGGKLKNMHKNKRPKGTGFSGRPTGGMAKTIVVGMLERNGRVKANVVEERTTDVLQEMIRKHIAEDATLITDEFPAYKHPDLAHEVINHANEYVRGQIHTNGIENFWSLLKRSLGGTYVSVEPFHLFRYIDEQAFRFNTRATKDNPLNDADRFAFVMSKIGGKRLTYTQLTGKTGQLPQQA